MRRSIGALGALAVSISVLTAADRAATAQTTAPPQVGSAAPTADTAVLLTVTSTVRAPARAAARSAWLTSDDLP